MVHGYQHLVDNLAKSGFEIRLNHRVTEIDYSNDNVKLVCIRTHSNGDEETTVVECERVVVTLPIGVLCENSVKFRPELPTSKIESMDKIGNGVLDKLFLKFERVFWPDRDFIVFVSKDDGEIGWWTEMFNLHRHCGENLVCFFNSASIARSAAKQLPDLELVESALSILRRNFGEIPQLVSFLRSSWSVDPFAKGSYTFLKVGATVDDRDRLAAPVNSLLFFAGEATTRWYPGTVHGAYASGLRAANEILALKK